MPMILSASWTTLLFDNRVMRVMGAAVASLYSLIGSGPFPASFQERLVREPKCHELVTGYENRLHNRSGLPPVAFLLANYGEIEIIPPGSKAGRKDAHWRQIAQPSLAGLLEAST